MNIVHNEYSYGEVKTKIYLFPEPDYCKHLSRLE